MLFEKNVNRFSIERTRFPLLHLINGFDDLPFNRVQFIPALPLNSCPQKIPFFIYYELDANMVRILVLCRFLEKNYRTLPYTLGRFRLLS